MEDDFYATIKFKNEYIKTSKIDNRNNKDPI